MSQANVVAATGPESWDHGFMKYPRLKGTHKDHGIQLLALHRTPQHLSMLSPEQQLYIPVLGCPWTGAIYSHESLWIYFLEITLSDNSHQEQAEHTNLALIKTNWSVLMWCPEVWCPDNKVFTSSDMSASPILPLPPEG